MKLLIVDGENKVYLTMKDAVECGFVEARLREAKSRGVKCWDLIDDPEDLRRVLMGYEALRPHHKEMVQKRFGNPYDHVARTPIMNMVNAVTNFKENEFFLKYRYSSVVGETAKALPIETVNRYTRADKWLRMLAEVPKNKQKIKKTLGLTMAEFYAHAGELIRLEKTRGKMSGYAGLDVLPGDFPSVYRKLLPRVEKYKKEGHEGIIDPLFGNKLGAKIGKIDPESGSKGGAFALERYEEQMAVIRTIAAMHNNFDAGQVCKMANIVFDANGWRTLKIGAIYNIITGNMHLLTPGRRGKRTYMSEVARQVKRKAPESPLLYWTEDGWTVELMYQERGAKGIEYKRMVAVIVLDACGKYPVGYAIGDRENTGLIREANRNALKHIYDLTGKPYRPWQMQSDNYGLKNLTPFYQAMTHLHSPAAVGNAKSKIIEPYFMYLNKNYCQLLPNWSGFNINSKKDNQVNVEKMDKIKNTFPDKAGVIKQIETIIAWERKANGEQYLANFKKTAPENIPEELTDMDYLMVMGLPLGRTNKITGQGIIKQVNGAEYTFDSFDPAFRAHMHLDWQLYGDEYDLSKVLAMSPDTKLRFVLEQTRILPMDVRSTTQEDRDYRSRIETFNKDRMQEVIDLYGSDADMAREIMDRTPLALDSPNQLALKMMFTTKGQQKEAIQDAKGLQRAQRKMISADRKDAETAVENWEEQQKQYMQERNDFSIYGQ